MTTFDMIGRNIGSSRHRVIQVRGELGLPDVERLEEILDATEPDEGVVVGLGLCGFIDSIALAALMRAHNRFAEDGRRLVIAAPTTQVRRVLQISGLEIDGLVFDSVDEALAG
jgi:anti-anti-sigma factor